MIDNIDEVKKELTELASVINAFTSEAVQLRLVEMIFSRSTGGISQIDTKPRRRAKRRQKSPRSTSDASNDQLESSTNKSSKSRSPSGTGAVATLVSVYNADFFKKPRTIGDVLEHCETNLARKIKANEISGKLGRMVRDGELKRAKNADGQYEYTAA